MLKHYRVPLFELLYTKLSEQGHDLRVVCGDPPAVELTRNDNRKIDAHWCYFPGSYWLFTNKLHWLHNSREHLQWADLIISEQASKHIHNYLALFLRRYGNKRLAWWGHGRNLQGNPRSLREYFKRQLASRCDWWFAYTQGVAEYLVSLGYPRERITVLNNSVDTDNFRKSLDSVDQYDLDDWGQSLTIPTNAKVGLFCGSLHPDKCLPFLLKAANRIHKEIPEFLLLIIGGGKDDEIVRSAASENEFIRYLGPVFGLDKARAFRRAQLLLCPGLVGLAILDSFAAGIPLCTTEIPWHSPEIEYLVTGVNGIITEHSVSDYALKVIDLLKDEKKYIEMSKKARAHAEQYTIEAMCDAFINGINQIVQADGNGCF